MQLTNEIIVVDPTVTTATSELEQKMLRLLGQNAINSIQSPGLYAKDSYGGRTLVETLEAALGGPNSYAEHVGLTVRGFSEELNNAQWTNPNARASGLVRLGVAQLFSRSVVDPGEWLQKVAVGLVREILPMGLRTVRRMLPDLAAELTEMVGLCEGMNPTAPAADFAAAMNRVSEALEVAYKKASPSRYWRDGTLALLSATRVLRSVCGPDYGEYTVLAAERCAGAAVLVAETVACGEASKTGAELPYCGGPVSDLVLTRAAELGAVAMRELGSPGGQWLDMGDYEEVDYADQ